MKGFTTTVLLLTTLVTSTTAIAETKDKGFYIGAALGDSTLSTQNGIFDNLFDLNEEKVFEDSSALSWGLYGGYTFNNWFSIESSAFHMKHDIQSKEKVTTTSFSLSSKFTIPIHDLFSIYAKAGLGYINLKYDFKYDNNTADNISDTEDDFAYLLGLGANVNLTEYLTLTLGYDWMQSMDVFALAGTITIEQVTLSLTYKF
ncbi:outer membrane beta-barrel protein [uncultured Shewanella sp.]|uniref:outer membrane beta-barrel protein n=1 Tax=uncultured Shewanella sp. TaxID=173975 RepID=UPI0026070CD1|nr:outer membrane beta-barrel protein [uncultured Shewanella sp.]